MITIKNKMLVNYLILAIDGMVKELKDPYSEYMTKDETKSFNEDVSGDFVGVGAEMQKR